jgi:hypothetical protein
MARPGQNSRDFDYQSSQPTPQRENTPNTYEAPGCQESNVSRQRILAFFPALLMLASLAIGRVS